MNWPEIVVPSCKLQSTYHYVLQAIRHMWLRWVTLYENHVEHIVKGLHFAIENYNFQLSLETQCMHAYSCLLVSWETLSDELSSKLFLAHFSPTNDLIPFYLIQSNLPTVFEFKINLCRKKIGKRVNQWPGKSKEKFAIFSRGPSSGAAENKI